MSKMIHEVFYHDNDNLDILIQHAKNRLIGSGININEVEFKLIPVSGNSPLNGQQILMEG